MKTLSRVLTLTVIALAPLVHPASLSAAPITWIGGNAPWDGTNANWSPADEPDANDEAIFIVANIVNMANASDTIMGLTLSGGIDLFTNGNDLTVDGLIQLSNPSTNFFIEGATSGITAQDVTVNADATLRMNGGTLNVIKPGAPNGQLLVNADGTLVGNGTINLNDVVAAGTVLMTVSGGTLTATSTTPGDIFGTNAATLSINVSDADARIDLDNVSAIININRNDTLDVNGIAHQAADPYSGTLNLAEGATINMSASWQMDSGTINANTGAPLGGAGSAATIAGAAFTMNGGTINLDAIDSLQFSVPFSQTAGTIANAGTLIFNADSTIGVGANLQMTGDADLIIEANRDVDILQTNFNMDAAGTAGSQITVNSGGRLDINVSDYETDAGANSYDGTITLNSGDISVFTADAEFVMDGTLDFNPTAFVSEWLGEPLDIGNDDGALDANLNVTGTNISRIVPQVDFNSDADVNIAAGAELQFNGLVNFQTVNGDNNAQFTGAGEITFNGPIAVLEAVTLNMVGGTVDLDGSDGFGDIHTINAALVINAATVENFGRVNGGGGINTITVNNSVGTGVLTVNLDDPASEWTLNPQGVLNLVNDNNEATLLAGSDVNINGTVNVTGDVRTTARVDIAGVVNINTAGQPLRLAGTGALESNRIEGGTINGPGLLGADTNTHLVGFGTINASVDFDGVANLFADDGQLTVNGDILDVNVIGSANATGILNVVNPWNTSVATTVVNQFGGEIRGGTITVDNANGIRGTGLVASRVINNSRIVAAGFFVGQPSGTHVFQTAGNNNDWDGAAGAGTLAAVEGHTLELRDVGAAFGFAGSVEVGEGSRVFTSGFALDFNPGSTLNLTQGTYESTNSTDLGGTVTVFAGGESTIEVANNSFLTFDTGSDTTLGSNLRLLNNNINIEAGADFSGMGALIVPDGSALVADPGSNIGVLLVNQGRFDPGGITGGVGIVDVDDFQQTFTGDYFTEIEGPLLNQLDRVDVAGVAALDGRLVVDLDNMFDPVLGSEFDIITAASVSGAFHTIDFQNLPSGQTFHVDYRDTSVRLTAVTTPFFSADFDDDGDVDSTDLAIWQGAYDLNQLGDADGDNDSDGRDFLLWQQQFGSAPLLPLESLIVPEPGGAILFPGCLLLVYSLGRSSLVRFLS